MIGMNSPTVDRLESMGLRREGLAGNPSMRSRMTYGNHLFLSRADGRFEQNALSHSIARAGWSWGCGAADFDNDGFPEVFIANGMESRESVRDYEPEYWLHDAFVSNSARSPTTHAYFQAKFRGLSRQRAFLRRLRNQPALSQSKRRNFPRSRLSLRARTATRLSKRSGRRF